VRKKPSAQECARFYEILRKVPKTEIHLHLEALATVDTIWALMRKNKISCEGVASKEDLARRYQIKTLDEFISVFINIVQNSFRTEEDFEFLLKDAAVYIKKNNIRYAEVFFAPTKFLRSGFDFAKIMRTLSNGAAALRRHCGAEIRFIIDVSRTFGEKNAMRNLELILSNKPPEVIGIGLGGAEAAGPAKDFGTVFTEAKAAGLRVVAHAGEDVGPASIWDTLNYLHAERIGHGISAVQDEKLMAHLAEHAVPLEICPTSNLFTRKFVQNIEEHPVREFYNRGICVTINSDDPALFSTSLIDEYMLLYKNGVFADVEIARLIQNNINATFLPEHEKRALSVSMKEAWNALYQV
jgi:adenosine deaminase